MPKALTEPERSVITSERLKLHVQEDQRPI